MKKLNYKVYMLTNENGPFWVGVTTNLKQRLMQHKNNKMGAAYPLTKNGDFKCEEILTVDTVQLAELFEAFLIKRYGKKLLNKATGGRKGYQREKKSAILSINNRNRSVTDSQGNVFNTIRDAAHFHRVSVGTISHNLAGNVKQTFSKRNSRKERVKFSWSK